MPFLPAFSAAESTQHASETRYRADIDGLRALAVLLVVSFHTELGFPHRTLPWLGNHLSFSLASGLQYARGGFVGVDIFFVISGFLISGILLREQERGTFSLVNFYERRIRRILPALAVMLLFTLLIAWFAATPSEFEDLAKSNLAAAFSFANVYFWKTSGYFDQPSFQKPLLHTWSLAVEEQFYLLFPLALLFLHRFSRKTLTTAVVLLAGLSFVASVFGTYHYPIAAFYLPPTRAWELLLGTIVALNLFPAPAFSLGRNLLSVLGLTLILIPAFRYTAETRFPGLAALPPCLGTSFILVADRAGPSLVGRLLSARPVVFVGLISYSLYLWHWPLFLINKYNYFPIPTLTGPMLLVVMLVCATLSWRYVERPFRVGRLKLPRRQLFVAAAVAIIGISVFSGSVIATEGMPSRFSPENISLARFTVRGPLEGQWGTGCFASTSLPLIQTSCLTEATGQPNYLLFGDSHAAHLIDGLSTVFPQVHWLEATGSSCPPVLSNSTSPNAFCRDLIENVFNRFLPSHHVDAILLSAGWGDDIVLRSIGKTVARLHAGNFRVYVIGPTPVYDQPLPDLLIKANRRHDLTLPSRSMNPPDAQFKALDDQLAAIALTNGADRYISLRRLLCEPAPCVEYAAPNVPLMFDGMHLTGSGSRLIAEKLRRSGELP